MIFHGILVLFKSGSKVDVDERDALLLISEIREGKRKV
jgi:hypothetical protein